MSRRNHCRSWGFRPDRIARSTTRHSLARVSSPVIDIRCRMRINDGSSSSARNCSWESMRIERDRERCCSRSAILCSGSGGGGVPNATIPTQRLPKLNAEILVLLATDAGDACPSPTYPTNRRLAFGSDNRVSLPIARLAARAACRRSVTTLSGVHSQLVGPNRCRRTPGDPRRGPAGPSRTIRL